MTSNSISKISDKLAKVSGVFTVNMYDNGYMLEISGRDHKGDHQTVKIICAYHFSLVSLVTEAVSMERDN